VITVTNVRGPSAYVRHRDHTVTEVSQSDVPQRSSHHTNLQLRTGLTRFWTPRYSHFLGTQAIISFMTRPNRGFAPSDLDTTAPAPPLCPPPCSFLPCPPSYTAVMGRRECKVVFASLRKLFLFLSIILAVMDVGLVDVGDVLLGEKQLGKVCVHLCWALTWEAVRKTQARRYLQRNRGITFKSAAWFHAVRDHAPEQRFRTYFRVSRSTFSKLPDVLWAHARPILRRRRGGALLALDLQLAITLYRLGHYGDACSVDAVADLFGISVGAVMKSTRRVAKALSKIAPEHIKWPSRTCRAASSRFAADGYGFQACIGATDSTTFLLAYQPALHPWLYLDRKSRYGLNGIITCDWNCNVINVRLGCTCAAPDTFV